MPLHISISETIHNRRKSKKLIQIMNKLGLSMSYEEMEHVNYALKLRIIKQAGYGRVSASTSICSSNIIHGAMDNFDQEEDTNSSIKRIHDTVMVIFQNNVKPEIEESSIGVLPTNDVISKNRRSATNLLKCKLYYHLEHLGRNEILRLIINARKTLFQIKEPLIRKRISYNGHCVGVPLLHTMLNLYPCIMLQNVC